MSLDYPDRSVWLAKRDTPTGRIARIRRSIRMVSAPTYKKIRLNKAEHKRLKKFRMAAMYREFFEDPKNIERIKELKLFWCIPFNPRLVRDTVLGSRRYV